MNKIRLGGHLSLMQGLSVALATARGMDYSQVQLSSAPGREYEPYELDEETLLQLRNLTYELEVNVHLPYVLNPCEGAPRKRGFYKSKFKENLVTAQMLGARRLVLHPGFKKELSLGEAKKNLMDFITDAWDDKSSMKLLLEVDSGSKNGSKVGSPEFLREVINELEVPNLGMCLDTEHMYARGVDLFERDVRERFLDTFDHFIQLVHLNCPDVEVKLGGHLDRHNTPFEDRPELDAAGLIEAVAKWPLILERSSVAVQMKDNKYVRQVLGSPLEKQQA